MTRRICALILYSFCLHGAVPTPAEHLGFEPGADYKLASYSELTGYFQKLAAGSNRIRLVEYGRTSLGKPSYIAFISSAENLKQLDRYREISRRLALGEATQEEAKRLAAEGKVIVWIDSGLHATEVAPAQHSPELAYRMLTAEDDETRRIRDNVILLQVPCINPDGLDMVVKWYRQNVGTPYELAPLPELYQKYAGHDNNRDWFMMNLRETRNVARLLFREWFPQIVYNQHQSPAFPARIFVPPYAEPLNPNIPATVMEGINLIGSAMKERFAREDKPGVLSYHGYDAWWNGGLRSAPAFHNMHGILTETALYAYATPKTYSPGEFPERFTNGIPTKEPTVFYQRPWTGGKWGVRQAIDYMLTADFAILDQAAVRREQFLLKAWEMARANIDAGAKGKPFAYIVPDDQPDRFSAEEMLRRLLMSGIEVRRARSEFSAGGKTYARGTWVVPAAQAFRGHVLDLFEPQRYPELRMGTTGPTKRPYDVAGWTLTMLMGVQAPRVEEPFTAELERVDEIPARDPSLDHRDNSSFIATADLLSRNVPVRWAANGAILRGDDAGFNAAAYALKRPKVGLFVPFTSNMDTGWTEWVLDTFKVPYTALRNADIQKGNLRAQFDTVIFASQTIQSILHGYRQGERTSRRTLPAPGEVPAMQRPEYTGGIGVAGVAQLQTFVREGGTLIMLDDAAELPVQMFPLSVRGALTGEGDSGATGYYSPGSLLRVTVDDTNPIAFGMSKEAIVFSDGGQAWDLTVLPEFNKGDREVRSVARYATANLLASGWVSGERIVHGRHILLDASFGNGRVVLFGFRPQFRGQTWGTLKFLLNAIYLGSAQRL